MGSDVWSSRFSRTRCFHCLPGIFMNGKRLCFIRVLNLTNIYIPHNVQLVVFLSFNYDGKQQRLRRVANIWRRHRVNTKHFSIAMCVNLSVKLTFFWRNDINDQIFSWENEWEIEKLEQMRREKNDENF